MYGRRPRKLAPIISAQGLSKTYGVAPLFRNISFTVSEGDHIGVIGPDGSGKSTLLEMLIGRVKPDSGDVAIRKGTRLSYVSQISGFAGCATIRSGIETALVRTGRPEAEELYLHAQKKRQESLENRVHTELEWLRRGPKARATKAKARIDKAHEMIGELAEMNARSRTSSAEIDFSATNRKTKQLVMLEGISFDVGGRTLFKDIHFSVTSR